MSDREQMPVSGGGPNKGDADGVNEPGRGAGGDSAGGADQNPHEGKEGDSSIGGFLGHGGQSEIAYHGAGQPQDRSDPPNGAAGSGDDDADEKGPKPGPTGPDQDFSGEYPREIAGGDGRRIEVVDTSGIAAAEAAGTTGTEGQEKTTDQPGSG